MMAQEPVWQENDLDPRKILLDLRNPRIEIPEDADQSDIRLKLLELEDVLELARNIVKNVGLFYGERVITVVENGKHVVLEGNRRVAALQMLLAPALVPKEFSTRFPAATPALRRAIQRIRADVAPSREAAEPILTKRHTEQGAKPWSPVAKMRRAMRLMEHKSVDEVAQTLGTSAAQVRKLIKPYKLLKYAFELKCWSHDERLLLENEKLTTNPYTRVFTLKETINALQIHFDSDQNIVSALPKKVFTQQMERIARDFLLPDPTTGKPPLGTRADMARYFADLTESQGGGAGKPKPGSGKGGADSPGGGPTKPGTGGTQGAGTGPSTTTVQPKTPKASTFFENLECHIQDDRLIKLTGEIRTINHITKPIAASMLVRALFECALFYKVQKTGKWKELIKSDGRDPGLNEIIKFCAKFENGVFTEQNICKALNSHATHSAKSYFDSMNHLKYQEADSNTLVTVANALRQVIQYILAGH
ncbi:hypothetical protein [Paraburkholderia aspalathi]|uniref:hypothetical protein n=1 Tax=Paraburkholderia aspalathi TaxID=1324617 RepID=UPI003CA84CC5